MAMAIGRTCRRPRQSSPCTRATQACAPQGSSHASAAQHDTSGESQRHRQPRRRPTPPDVLAYRHPPVINRGKGSSNADQPRRAAPARSMAHPARRRTDSGQRRYRWSSMSVAAAGLPDLAVLRYRFRSTGDRRLSGDGVDNLLVGPADVPTGSTRGTPRRTKIPESLPRTASRAVMGAR